MIKEAPPLAARVYAKNPDVGSPILSVPTVAGVLSIVIVRAVVMLCVRLTVEPAPPGTTAGDQLAAVFQLSEASTFQLPLPAAWAVPAMERVRAGKISKNLRKAKRKYEYTVNLVA